MSKEAAMAIATQAPVDNPVESVDNSTPVTTPETPKEVDSDRFARLAAKEAKLVKERESFKTEQQKIYEEKKKLEAVQAQIEEFESLRKTDPVEALKKIGFSEDDMFNFLAGKHKEPPSEAELARQAAAEEIKKFQEAQEARAKKEAEERDLKAINSFKGEITSQIKKESEKFEFLNYQGAIGEELVYDTILEIYKLDKDIPPHEAMKEALESAEAYYEEEAKKLLTLKKLAAKAQPVVEEPKAPVSPSRQVSPSLTNKATATVAATIPRKETREEKRARLEDALRNAFKRT